MNPTSTHEEAPPAYTKGGQQQITTADFQVRAVLIVFKPFLVGVV